MKRNPELVICSAVLLAGVILWVVTLAQAVSR